jgi:hypothetical protein
VFGNELRGGFRGTLTLLVGTAHRDFFSMLINIPTGLHFTNLVVRVDGRHFQGALNLVEACKHSLEKLRFVPEGESPWHLHA